MGRGSVVTRASITVGLGLVSILVVPPAVASERVETIQFVRTLTTTSVADVGRKGPSIGDITVELHELRRSVDSVGTPTGPQVGVHSVTTTRLGATARNVLGTVTLPGGTITAGGVGAGAPGTLAILGGTGIYAGARGTLGAASLSQRISERESLGPGLSEG